MRTALVLGCDGQDGLLLERLLLSEGCRVVGIARGSSRDSGGPPPPPVDLLDAGALEALVAERRPDEAYYLAAYHHSSQDVPADDSELLRRSRQVHVQGLVNTLEALERRRPKARLFYASSAHVFSPRGRQPLDESSPIAPRSPYGVSKAEGMQACRRFREARGLAASCGILFNHESPLRHPRFVFRKVARAAVRIAAGLEKELVLGDLSSAVDWGWAEDYVKAMLFICRHDPADDFVVATGELRTVGELAELAFREVGLDWRRHVREDRSLLTKPSETYVGNSAKLAAATGWRPQTSFPEMVKAMIRAERGA